MIIEQKFRVSTLTTENQYSVINNSMEEPHFCSVIFFKSYLVNSFVNWNVNNNCWSVFLLDEWRWLAHTPRSVNSATKNFYFFLITFKMDIKKKTNKLMSSTYFMFGDLFNRAITCQPCKIFFSKFVRAEKFLRKYIRKK